MRQTEERGSQIVRGQTDGLKGYRLRLEQNAHTYVTHTHAVRRFYQEALINTNEFDSVIRSPAAFRPPPVSIVSLKSI